MGTSFCWFNFLLIGRKNWIFHQKFCNQMSTCWFSLSKKTQLRRKKKSISRILDWPDLFLNYFSSFADCEKPATNDQLYENSTSITTSTTDLSDFISNSNTSSSGNTRTTNTNSTSNNSSNISNQLNGQDSSFPGGKYNNSFGWSTASYTKKRSLSFCVNKSHERDWWEFKWLRRARATVRQNNLKLSH